ncbi:MAG: macro domain-containing protein [Candidatus Omnitrophota bacterium]|nr:macro domain-containing protein [Candidatus Omnitrophota bacterium]
MKIKDCEIEIIKADITRLDVDAIVNPANNKLLMGGGVAGAIKRKGGKIIEQEALSKGTIKIGETIVTTGGKLAAKYVIHAATMGMDFKTDEAKIRKSSAGSLRSAEQMKIKSIAFPALGCGVGGFSYLASAKIMAQEIVKYLRGKGLHLRKIIFCLYDQEAYRVFNKAVFRYLGHIAGQLQKGPFVTVDAIVLSGEKIVLVKRTNPPFGWAMPGGFVDYGESLEQAVRREVKEETGLDLEGLKQFHTYSKPDRDPRFHTVSTVYTGQGKGRPVAGSDAGSLAVVGLTELGKYKLAFDHKEIVGAYLKMMDPRHFLMSRINSHR